MIIDIDNYVDIIFNIYVIYILYYNIFYNDFHQSLIIKYTMYAIYSIIIIYNIL